MRYPIPTVLLVLSVAIASGYAAESPASRSWIENSDELLSLINGIVARNYPSVSAGDGDNSFIIRDDSYTDNTGVAHIFVQQRIHGLEVIDSDMGFNIFNGALLGSRLENSFFKGPTPPPPFLSSSDLGTDTPEDPEILIDANPDAMPQFHHLPNFAVALLEFVKSTNPSALIGHDPDDVIRNMVINPVHRTNDDIHRPGGHRRPVPKYTVDNVPGAMKPVNAELAYAKTSGGREVTLVWKVDVMTKDNWYSAAVGVDPPYTIMSLDDWASTSSPGIW